MSSSPILVIGDCIVDEYYEVERVKPSPEHDGVCLVNPRLTRRVPGGAAHVAMTLARMGLDTLLVGVLHAPTMVAQLEHEPHLTLQVWHGVDRAGHLAPTCVKRRYQQDGRTLARHDEDPDRRRLAYWQSLIEEQLPTWIDGIEVVVTSDYDKGTLTDRMVDTIRRASPRIWIADPKRCYYEGYRHPNLVFKPNAREALTLSGMTTCAHAVTALAVRVLGSVVVTAGEHGIWYGTTDYVDHHPAHPVMPTSVVGAGDTATAVLAAGLSRGWTLPQAVRACTEACAHIVTQPGTTPLDAQTWRRVVDLIEVT